MRPVRSNEPRPTRHLVRAALLLVGLGGVGYGYFNDHPVCLGAGVLLIVANVIHGVVDLVGGGKDRGSR
jgi:hypothetical protein